MHTFSLSFRSDQSLSISLRDSVIALMVVSSVMYMHPSCTHHNFHRARCTRHLIGSRHHEVVHTCRHQHVTLVDHLVSLWLAMSRSCVGPSLRFRLHVPREPQSPCVARYGAGTVTECAFSVALGAMGVLALAFVLPCWWEALLRPSACRCPVLLGVSRRPCHLQSGLHWHSSQGRQAGACFCREFRTKALVGNQECSIPICVALARISPHRLALSARLVMGTTLRAAHQRVVHPCAVRTQLWQSPSFQSVILWTDSCDGPCTALFLFTLSTRFGDSS